MNQEFQAIYENGILRLVKPLDLPDQTPVHGVVDLSDADSTSSADEELLTKQRLSLKAMKERIESIPQNAGSDGFSNRDHDALLYGQDK